MKKLQSPSDQGEALGEAVTKLLQVLQVTIRESSLSNQSRQIEDPPTEMSTKTAQLLTEAVNEFMDSFHDCNFKSQSAVTFRPRSGAG